MPGPSVPLKSIPLADLRHVLKVLKDNGGFYAQAAKELGVCSKTVKRRVAELKRRRPAEVPESFTDPASISKNNRRAKATLDDENLLRATWAVFEAHNYVVVRTAEALGLSQGAASARLQKCRMKLGLKEDPAKVGKGQAEEQHRIDQVQMHRARSDASIAKSRLKDAVGEIARLQDRLKDLEWVANAQPTPADWVLPSRSPGKSEHMPYLLTSDFQVGEVIRAEETDHGHAFNTEIFRHRYRHMISTTIYLAQEHSGSSWKFPGIIYARGGDAISGGIHDELRETDDLTPIQACEIVFEEEAAGIRMLADTFGKVFVPDVIGNHGRTTHKPRAKQAAADNFETLISYMLRREFRNDARITFMVTESPDAYFPIYDKNILLTHGDKIGSRGGQGFIGPAATIMRGAQKVIMEQAAIGRHVDEVHMGHFHTPFWTEWVTCNGCMPGYSEFAKMHRMRPSEPQQFLKFYHPKRGMVDLKPIILTGAI